MPHMEEGKADHKRDTALPEEEDTDHFAVGDTGHPAAVNHKVADIDPPVAALGKGVDIVRSAAVPDKAADIDLAVENFAARQAREWQY